MSLIKKPLGSQTLIDFREKVICYLETESVKATLPSSKTDARILRAEKVSCGEETEISMMDKKY